MMAPKTMNCREVGLRLQTYLDGELDGDRREALAGHLEDCRKCGLEADVFRQIKSDLAQSAAPTDSEALARLRSFSERIASEAAEFD